MVVCTHLTIAVEHFFTAFCSARQLGQVLSLLDAAESNALGDALCNFLWGMLFHVEHLPGYRSALVKSTDRPKKKRAKKDKGAEDEVEGKALPHHRPSCYQQRLFDAILDPLFDEDVFLRRMKTQPPMPLGDHC